MRSTGFLGHHHTIETKIKQSKALKGRPKPKGFGAKISKARMGHVVTQETRTKLSKSRMGRFTGENSSWYGRHHTQEAITRMREANG